MSTYAKKTHLNKTTPFTDSSGLVLVAQQFFEEIKKFAFLDISCNFLIFCCVFYEGLYQLNGFYLHFWTFPERVLFAFLDVSCNFLTDTFYNIDT